MENIKYKFKDNKRYVRAKKVSYENGVEKEEDIWVYDTEYNLIDHLEEDEILSDEEIEDLINKQNIKGA
jgi:hypothetical protein